MPASATGPFYVAADHDGRDLRVPQITYRIGRGAPDGHTERVLFAGYRDSRSARQAAGETGQVFEVRGAVAATDGDGHPMFRSVTVLAQL